MAIGATHALIYVIEQWLLEGSPGVRSRIHEVIGVNDAHNVFEFVHPSLGCEWCSIPDDPSKRTREAT